MNKSYTVSEAATQLGLSAKTLRRWEETGRFHSTRTLGGQRRYSSEDLQILDAISNNIIASDQELLTPLVAAKLLGVSVPTLNRYEQMGQIHSFVTSENTYYIKSHLLAAQASIKPDQNTPTLTPFTPTPTTNTTKPTTSELTFPTTPKTLTLPPSKVALTLSHHDLKMIIINIMVTTLMLTFYHLLTPSYKPIPSVVTPTQTSQSAQDPKLDILKNMLDPTGNLSVAGSVRTNKQVLTPQFVLLPTIKPTSPSAGTAYFDASSQTFQFFDGTTWLILNKAPTASTSAAPTTR